MYRNKILEIILGGGKGSRLYPLTKLRCKPAISLGGKYRLIDIPISNCLNSRIDQIYILTQFMTESIHRHIFDTYRMDMLRDSFVRVLAAEQTLTSNAWYQGTADAVRRSIRYFKNLRVEDILILSGDQLCAMDFEPIYDFHKNSQADLTIIGHPVADSEAHRMGIIKTDENDRILKLIEKPNDLKLVEGFKNKHGQFMASTGNYFFKKDFLLKVLTEFDDSDFGKKIIPQSINTGNAFHYPYNEYWEDIGTIKSFFEANLKLTDPVPELNLYIEGKSFFTHPRFLPAAKIQNSNIKSSLISEGSLIEEATIEKSVIGIRSVIDKRTNISHSIIMGNDYYENNIDGIVKKPKIGKNVHIEQAIIDKNVIIEDDVVIKGTVNNEHDFDGDLYSTRDGIIVISKGTVIPKGTVIKA
ncbi:MAG: glucose-1-phosphate adenylyltransferase [Omnitrophica WOR_2 bacterium GWA2_37_7]|nr:MAG: glucose-1-phosphate adenylyltransferase [Omnitrophica WOR_2 bacterium GWA2_37_7]